MQTTHNTTDVRTSCPIQSIWTKTNVFMDLINITKGIIKVIHRWTFKAMAKRKKPKHKLSNTTPTQNTKDKE